MTDLSTFETQCANELGLSTTEEKDVIDNALNLGVQRVLEDTHCYVVRIDYNGFDGSSDDWTLDASILDIVEMYTLSSGTRYSLSRVSITDLLEKRRVGIPSGTPTQFYAVSGANLIMFWPPPGPDDTLTVYGIPIPTPLSGDTDDPSNTTYGGIPSILHRAIFYFACSELGSYDDDQSSAQGQRYRDWYTLEIARYHKIIREKGGNRNARAIVNEKRRRRAYHTNDIYPAI